MVGDHVVVVAEPLFAEGADAILGDNLAVQQLAHLRVGTNLPVSAGMLGIVDAADTKLPLTSLIWD